MMSLEEALRASVAINEVAKQCHETSKSKGWWDEFVELKIDLDYDGPPPSDMTAAKIALIHSELSEALECLRTGKRSDMVLSHPHPDSDKPEGFVVEMADAVIRIFDLCQAHGLDIGEAIVQKMAYNTTRPHRHGGKAL